MQEHEIKYLNIDRADLESKLVTLGAKKIRDYHYRRIVFDFPDFKLEKMGAWLRLRDEGDRVTLTFKQRITKDVQGLSNDLGMYEKETVVGNFEDTREILLKTGLIEKMYQENKRTRYELGDVTYDIDTWPLLNPYLEIESDNWDKVYAGAKQLGFKKEDAKIFSANQVYRLQGLDDRNFTKLTFKEQIERTENRF